eukprot:15318797-Alexandrium_andersonii.AAC.1
MLIAARRCVDGSSIAPAVSARSLARGPAGVLRGLAMLSMDALERSSLQWKPADQFCYALSPGTCPIGTSADASELLDAMVSQRAFEADL